LVGEPGEGVGEDRLEAGVTADWGGASCEQHLATLSPADTGFDEIINSKGSTRVGGRLVPNQQTPKVIVDVREFRRCV
jgi:hypothetical protein